MRIKNKIPRATKVMVLLRTKKTMGRGTIPHAGQTTLAVLVCFSFVNHDDTDGDNDNNAVSVRGE